MGMPAPVAGGGPSCDAGSCAPLSCEAGGLRCNGAMLELCSADGRSWLAQQRCATSCLCELGVAAGSCAPSQCVAEEVRCNGNQVERCNACQTGYELIAECASAEACNATTAACDGGGDGAEPPAVEEPSTPEPSTPEEPATPVEPAGADAGSP